MMKFEQALEAMRKGKKVYQKKYKDKQLSLINNDMIKNDVILIDKIKTEDILAEDWEIVKEPVSIEELEEKIEELQNKVKELEKEKRTLDWQKDFLKEIYKRPGVYYK